MGEGAIVTACKELGCCDACCLRYLGVKNHTAYENPQKYLLKYEVKPVENPTNSTIKNEVTATSTINPTSKPYHTLIDPTTKPNPMSIDPASKTDPISVNPTSKLDSTSIPGPTSVDPTFKPDSISIDPTSKPDPTSISEPATISNLSPTIGSITPPPKRRRTYVCNTCLGLLQESSWEECCDMVKELLDKKEYECDKFACALLSPIATLVREKAVVLRLQASQRTFDPKIITALKEAWKWSLGPRLAQHVRKELDSGAVCPLLVTLNMEYPDELQELEILKTLSPNLFASRSRQGRRFAVEFTRRSVEQALDGVTLEALQQLEGWREGLPTPACAANCAGVSCAHAPVYLGGRYVKLSRQLPQTPWVVAGKRIMESSVQEIIMEPLAKLYQIPVEEVERRCKFMSAGREDVDVRCLRDGRPFAVEISDPRRQLAPAELQAACDVIATSGSVQVHKLVHVTKEQLMQLKLGEESKTKSYEALCVKIQRDRTDPLIPTVVTALPITAEDISRVNSYRNTPPWDPARVVLSQKTPIRVLHRRPLLTRTRKIMELTATKVEDQPLLFVVRIRTEAGTYVKEWVHGELGRTQPCLGDALGAEADILALDVAGIDLPWPPGP